MNDAGIGRWVAGVLIVLALASFGCGDDDTGPGQPGDAAASETKGDLSGVDLTLVTFGGDLANAVETAWIDPFEADTGAKVEMTEPTDYAKLKVQVESGNVDTDLAYADAFFVQANCGTIFEPLDTSKLVDAGIDERYITNDCGLPDILASWQIVYDRKQVGGDPPSGWSDFFDTGKYPGKRGIWNFVQGGALEAALLADGVQPDDLYPLDLDRAFRKLDTIKDDIVWTETTGQLTEQLVNEQVALQLTAGGRAYFAAKDGADIAPVYDQQILFWDNTAVVKGSPDAEAAKQFLYSVAGPERQARMTELTSYGNTSTRAKPKLDALLETYLSTSPEVQESAVLLDQEYWAEHFEEANERWTEWQTG
jgi:putative spermidine/putrescine transport system substrate-binding protein